MWLVQAMQQGAMSKKSEAWEGFWGTRSGGPIWTLHQSKWIQVYLHRQWAIHCLGREIVDDNTPKNTSANMHMINKAEARGIVCQKKGQDVN
jgi:hypothetical protein